MNKAVWLHWSRWSLRRKLVVVCALVQLAAAAVLIYASSRLLQNTLLEQGNHETRQVLTLLEHAMAPALAQRDYATLQQTLDLARDDAAIVYLVMHDHKGTAVASAGWNPAQPLPPRDTGGFDLDRADTTLHLAAPVAIAGQTLGQLAVGLSTERLRQTRAEFLRNSAGVGLAALALSMGLLTLLAMAITRHLARLAQASHEMALGNLDVQVPVLTQDEIGRLAHSFNAMAAALKDRVLALEDSQAQQQQHLGAAREEKARLAALLGALPGGIMFMDDQHQVVYANAAFSQIWSLPEIASGTAVASVVAALTQKTEPADQHLLQSLLKSPPCPTTSQAELHTRDGRLITQRMQPVAPPLSPLVAPQASGLSQGTCIWFHDDITVQRQTQQRAHQAWYDPLTGLLNRRGMHEKLNAELASAAFGGVPLSLLFIDLDDFKYANDAAGHRMGDDILVAVARTLTERVPNGPVVARLGGDEFAVLCPGWAAEPAAGLAATLVQAVAALRFAATRQTLRVGASIGVATAPADARGADDLMACADAAMFEAKRAGKNGWSAYRADPARVKADSARVNWNTRIHRALHDNRFVLHFQPVHRTSDLQVVHFEALTRMVDDEGAEPLIEPADFIPHAERSGSVRQIDRWVFETCVRQLATADAAVNIAANLSARSLEDPSFTPFLRRVLQGHGVEPRRLHIEVTETSAISDPAEACALINALRSLGCTVHLDDFGSGFSSFAHLKLLEVDSIKIDGTFVRSLCSDSSSRLFVASMVEIAHHLGKTVIAEQVEDAATLAVLRELEVDMVQGFHLSRPFDARGRKLMATAARPLH